VFLLAGLSAQCHVCFGTLLEPTVRKKKSLETLQFFLGGKILLRAAADFVEKDVGPDATYGCMGSHKLCKDFIARTTFVDHLLNPAQLPFDTSKAM
jgi:hypothetical protein